MDIKLLQTFKKIHTQSAMKVHDTSRGLVPASSSTNVNPLSSENNLRNDRKFGNVSELIAAKLVGLFIKFLI